MEFSPNLNLSFLAPQQSQKHVTVNESFRRLDALVQLAAASDTLAIEPANPNDGAVYILPSGASGASWDGFETHQIAAFQDGAWTAIAPRAGVRAWIVDAGVLKAFDGAQWIVASAVGDPAMLGVNATADAVNRLTVKSDAVLHSHDDAAPGTGDARHMINKAAAANTASLVFQTDYSGRAEFGLSGTDDFSVKVSADGAAFVDALTVDGQSAVVTIEKGLSLSNGAKIFNSGVGADPGVEIEGGGDLGACSLTVINQAGIAAGAVFAQKSDDPAIDLVDFGLNTLSHSILMRVESRAQYVATAAPEYQLVDNTSGTPVHLLRASATAVKAEAPVVFPQYPASALPDAAAAGAGATIFAPDAPGGAVLAFSDGSVWRRMTDRAIVG